MKMHPSVCSICLSLHCSPSISAHTHIHIHRTYIDGYHFSRNCAVSTRSTYVRELCSLESVVDSDIRRSASLDVGAAAASLLLGKRSIFPEGSRLLVPTKSEEIKSEESGTTQLPDQRRLLAMHAHSTFRAVRISLFCALLTLTTSEKEHDVAHIKHTRTRCMHVHARTHRLLCCDACKPRISFLPFQLYQKVKPYPAPCRPLWLGFRFPRAACSKSLD